MKMMVLQGVELVGIKSILHKQDIEFHHKGKAPRKVSSSSNYYNSNNDDDGNNGVVALVRLVEELVAIVVVIMLVKQIISCHEHEEMKITIVGIEH